MSTKRGSKMYAFSLAKKNEISEIFEFVLGAWTRFLFSKFSNSCLARGRKRISILSKNVWQRKLSNFRICAWHADAKKLKLEYFAFVLGAWVRKIRKISKFSNLCLVRGREKTKNLNLRICAWCGREQNGNFDVFEFSSFRIFAKTDGQPIFGCSNFCESCARASLSFGDG